MKIANMFFTSLIICFLIWLTNGWIFSLIILMPLFFWVKRKFAK